MGNLVFVTVATSIFLIVFGLGLKTEPGSLTLLLRQTGLMIRSLLAMNVVMPLLALTIALIFQLHPVVKFTLLAMAVSPVPPLLKRAQFRVGGSESYVFGLLVMTALLAIVLVPFTVIILGDAFGLQTRVAPTAVMRIVLRTVLVPLGLGMLVRRLSPGLAERIGKWAAGIGNALLLLGMVFILSSAWTFIGALLGNGTLAAIAIFVGTGLLVGHILGGPDIDDASALALACVCRHPGVALVIADANFRDQRQQIAAALLLYLAVSSIAMIAYAHWQKGRSVEGGEGVKDRPGRRKAV